MKFKIGDKVRVKSSITSLDLNRISVNSIAQKRIDRKVFEILSYRKVLYFPKISNKEVNCAGDWIFPEDFLELELAKSHPLTNIFKEKV